MLIKITLGYCNNTIKTELALFEILKCVCVAILCGVLLICKCLPITCMDTSSYFLSLKLKEHKKFNFEQTLTQEMF